MLGAAENTGLELRTVTIPLEDGQVGTTLATTASFAKSNPKEVAGYCRAMTKGLVFTTTNIAAAIRIFWEEFPTTKPANLDEATALKNSVHIMSRFLEKALQDQPENAPLGKFITQNWQNTHAAFVKLGTLKGSEAPTALLYGAVYCGLQRLRPRCSCRAGEGHEAVDEDGRDLRQRRSCITFSGGAWSFDRCSSSRHGEFAGCVWRSSRLRQVRRRCHPVAHSCIGLAHSAGPVCN